jgi:uncharacterized protein YndB with AHSA1/START domain
MPPLGLFALLLVGAAILVALLELLLARAVQRGAIERPEIRMSITINAPIARVWEIAADVQRQPEWMHEMKRVEMITSGALRVGSRGRATVRIFGISTTDDVVITQLEPPNAFGIRHEGRFTGEGLLLFSATPAGGTLINWTEYLRPPIFATIGGFVQRPILGAIFRSDLRHLKRLVEAGG